MSDIQEVETNGKEEEKTVQIKAEEAKALLNLIQNALKLDGSINSVPTVNYFYNKFMPLFKEE